MPGPIQNINKPLFSLIVCSLKCFIVP